MDLRSRVYSQAMCRNSSCSRGVGEATCSRLQKTPPEFSRQNLGVERALALMHQMMNREAGDHRIKLAQRGQRLVEIVGDDGNGGIAAEALARSLQHGRRKIDRHGLNSVSLADIREVRLNQRQQAPVARAEIENRGARRAE